MDAFRIKGGTPLRGSMTVDGSKNASLPMLAAALLMEPGEGNVIVLEQVPDLKDTRNMCTLLEGLGCDIQSDSRGTNSRITLSIKDTSRSRAHYDIVRTMRASVCVLGPLLARRGRAEVSMPGGCAFGTRPVDLHVRGLKALGARITVEGGYLVADIAEGTRLRGARIFLGGPFGSTVLGTANVMSAATLAEGRTIIESAACEPEIVALAEMLTKMGARISGAGSPRLTIDGVESLSGTQQTVIPDRIVAATFAIAAAITGGEIVIHDFPFDSLMAVCDLLARIGVRVDREDSGEPLDRCTVRVSCDEVLQPSILTTQPHPGFPTDLQAQMMVLLSLVKGQSVITEKIFPERFMHVAELSRMGAELFRQGQVVVVQGRGELVGAPVMASDLRASASLVLAGLAARGETIVSRVYHLDRGYVRMEETLSALGAEIERITDEDAADAGPGSPRVETFPAAIPRVPAAQIIGFILASCAVLYMPFTNSLENLKMQDNETTGDQSFAAPEPEPVTDPTPFDAEPTLEEPATEEAAVTEEPAAEEPAAEEPAAIPRVPVSSGST